MNPPEPRGNVYDQIGPAAQRLARVPRYGRLIAMLPPDRFDRLQSEAATIWEVYNYVAVDARDETGLLDDGLKATEAQQFGWHLPRECLERNEPIIRRWQVRLALDLLAAIAFEMFLGPDGTGSSPPMFTVDNKKVNLERFFESAFDRFDKSGAYQTARKTPINGECLIGDWKRLKAMDSHGLKHLVFSATEERLQFTDITTQAFLAAYWACRWANDDDRQTMWNWLPDPLGDEKEVYAEFWRFVTEMPDDAFDRARDNKPDRQPFELLLSRLYDGTWTDEAGFPIRSTELIYRSWDRMKETAAGRVFRRMFRELMKGTGDKAQIARRMLEVEVKSDSKRRESQFLSLCRGERGSKDTGRFEMGAPDDEAPEWDGRGERQNNPLHPVRLSHYRLHRNCVTNLEYELFDVRHVALRKFSEKVKDVGAHPVVNVTWYDAWCFTVWLGEIEVNGQRYWVTLPSEAQWEYACRAGETTPFTWDAGRDGTRIESGYCNFDGNNPWHLPGTRAAKEGPYRKRTVRVDGMDEDGRRIPENVWGFSQMHGNVWEWCGDWYGRGFYRRDAGQEVTDPVGPDSAVGRVQRGGCWFDYGRYCRSSYRSRFTPDYRRGDDGFRLAAVPVAAGGKKE